MPDANDDPTYLAPYLRAAQRHGAGFDSLLWASPRTQAVRFDALRRAAPVGGRTVLDVGCGRADYLRFLLDAGERPRHYVGLEAVPALADAAEAMRVPDTMIIRADFVKEPARMFVGADVVVFSGSLNTLDAAHFYPVLRRAYDAAVDTLAFNFLSSPLLAGRSFLHWHHPEQVLAFARTLTRDVTRFEDYLPGDCTLALRKPPEASSPNRSSSP
jgi:hypothetical protein